MSIPAATQNRFNKEIVFLKAIYMHLNPGEETEIGAATIGTTVDITYNVAMAYAQQFEKLGLIERRYVWQGQPTDKMAMGKHAFWKLTKPYEEALDILERDQAKRLEITAAKRSASASKPRTSKKMRESVEVTKAIVGPDAPTLGEAMPELRAARKDERTALIEAARQYAKRHEAAFGKLNELAATMADLGISFDIEKARAAFVFEPDDRLEAIALILPYIDRLERTNEQLGRSIVETSEKVRDYDRMKNENERLIRRVEALVSQGVTLAHQRQFATQ